MDESAAREALLVRAYEMAVPARVEHLWSDADREWATQATLRSVGDEADADIFIAERAGLAADRLRQRDAGAGQVLRALEWQSWIGWGLVLAALAAGFAGEAIGPARRVNVLAAPLMALLAWNLAVYVLLALRTLMRLARSGGPASGRLARLVATLGLASALRRARDPASPLAVFARDWIAASAPLTMARLAQVLHCAAAMFAIGAMFSMYLRGFAFEYRAGWESTFLQAPAVHALLSVVLGPAAAITGITLPDTGALASIRFPESTGENAARWIHLYAATILLIVLLPRAILAAHQALIARTLARSFALPGEDGYFSALARARGGAVATVLIVPYAMRPDPAAGAALQGVLARVFGTRVQLVFAPGVGFGEEDNMGALPQSATPPALLAALFALTATPERENQGAFLAALSTRKPAATPLVVLVDESAFRQRFGAAAATRVQERRAAWRRMLAQTHGEPVFVDLGRLEQDGEAERALNSAIGRGDRARQPMTSE